MDIEDTSIFEKSVSMEPFSVDVSISDITDEEPELINVEKDTEDSGVEELEDKAYSRFMQKTYKVINRIEDLGIPEKGHQIRLVTFRSFNAIHFLYYIAQKEKINHVLIAEAARLLVEMINKGLVGKTTILMSNLRNKAHRQKEQITRDIFVENPNIDLFFCASHAKIMSMQTDNGNYYTLEGSGNLSYNSRVEQYSLDNDEGLFLFTKDWMREVREYLKGTKELIET